MNSSEDRKLEEMLRSRRVESASPDLAERIILRAQTMPQNQTISLARRLKEMFAEFHLPRPAYVLAATLILGFVVGFNTPVETARDSSSMLPAQTFLDAGEEVL
jgi:hypothetical protein